MTDIKNNNIAAEPEVIDATVGAEILEKYEKESRTRNFSNKTLSSIVYVLCLIFTVYHLAYASGIRLLQMVNIKHHAIHVGMGQSDFQDWNCWRWQ